MTKELQNKVWASLPVEARAYIKEEYEGFSNADCQQTAIFMEDVFGLHNLTSDTEPEEILSINKEKFYNFYKLLEYSHNHDSLLYDNIYWKFIECLPDRKPIKFQPKFEKGDKVKYGDSICEILETEYSDERPYCIKDGGCTQWVAESDLEPYTEE